MPGLLKKLRRRIVFHWLAREGGGISAFAMFAIPVLALTSIVTFAYSSRTRDEPARERATQQRALELRCLAENIYFEARGEPWGPRWQQAIAGATAVIDDTYMPVVPDALYYHSTGVQPYWASSKRGVAKIGNHVFYR